MFPLHPQYRASDNEFNNLTDNGVKGLTGRAVIVVIQKALESHSKKFVVDVKDEGVENEGGLLPLDEKTYFRNVRSLQRKKIGLLTKQTTTDAAGMHLICGKQQV